MQEFRGTRGYAKPICLSINRPFPQVLLNPVASFNLRVQQPLNISHFPKIHEGRGGGKIEKPKLAPFPREGQPTTRGFGGHAALALSLHTQPLGHLPGKNGGW